MGISSQGFEPLQRALKKIFPDFNGIRMLELGNQSFTDECLLKYRDVIRGKIAKDYFSRLGFNHISIDITGLDGSVALDLNKVISDKNFIRQFDVVTNFGTSEHVDNQYNCFLNIHNFCKENGFFIHEVPEAGYWPGHSHYYYSRDFFRILAKESGYEIIELIPVDIPPNGNEIFCLMKKNGHQPFIDKDRFESILHYSDRPTIVDEYWKPYLKTPLMERLKEFIKRCGRRIIRKNIQKQRPDSIAVIFIGTGRYIEYFPSFYKTNIKFFLPHTKKTFFVLTDRVDYSYPGKKEDIVPVLIESSRWPLPTLFRFKYINRISGQLKGFSHIIFVDADMEAASSITEEEFFCHNRPLFGVQHPCHINRIGTFESNSGSLACVSAGSDLSTYWQGCFWGGQTEEVLKMSKELERRIDDDLSRGIIAVWHDESHLNKYFIENKNKVYTYHAGYAYPVVLSGKLSCRKKFIHLLKDHDKMRQSSR
ncbi:MAG: hypothetical protein WC482_06340 [Candidatus Omnitrophota bacterium]